MDMIVSSAQYIADINDSTKITAVKAVIDGRTVFVPNQEAGNRHWDAISDWVAAGNTIQDAD